jgi:hypothetical protein
VWNHRRCSTPVRSVCAPEGRNRGEARRGPRRSSGTTRRAGLGLHPDTVHIGARTAPTSAPGLDPHRRRDCAHICAGTAPTSAPGLRPRVQSRRRTSTRVGCTREHLPCRRSCGTPSRRGPRRSSPPRAREGNQAASAPWPSPRGRGPLGHSLVGRAPPTMLGSALECPRVPSRTLSTAQARRRSASRSSCLRARSRSRQRQGTCPV